MAEQRRDVPAFSGATLSFFGAAGTVTGSKYLLTTRRGNVLVDCGMFQGLRELRERNWSDPPFDPASVKAVLLTHAHIDHIGYLPRLVALGFRGPVFCSTATAKLAGILLKDSAKLQAEEAEFRNRNQRTRHTPALPLYDDDDVRRTLSLLRPLDSGNETVEVIDGVFAQWFPTGHVLGARMIHVTIDSAAAHGEQRTILFSGDVGRRDAPILPDPAPPIPADYLVVESTYGDRSHDRADPVKALAEVVIDAHDRNAAVLIPAFAVGRTQDILYHLRELEDAGEIPIVPVRADSPMAAQATELYLKATAEHDDETRRLRRNRRNPLRTHSMVFAESREESRRLNDETGARVVISASGMMSGGRVLHHAMRLVPDPTATICFVGYQAEGTLGRRLLDGESAVRIFKEWVPVRCRIVRIEGFSAHADAGELLSWMEPLTVDAPRRVFITHGEPRASAALSERIVERFGWQTSIPAHGESFPLR